MRVYGAAVKEVTRCLEDRSAFPRRDDANLKPILDAAGAPARAVSAYVFGRVCELRDKRDEAEWWYRASLDGDWTSATRPQAAAGLRRLGKEYYAK